MTPLSVAQIIHALKTTHFINRVIEITRDNKFLLKVTGWYFGQLRDDYIELLVILRNRLGDCLQAIPKELIDSLQQLFVRCFRQRTPLQQESAGRNRFAGASRCTLVTS